MAEWKVKSVDGEEVKSQQETEQAIVEEAVAGNPNVEIEDQSVIKVNLDEPPKQVEDEQQVSDEQQEEQPKDDIPETEAAADVESPLEIIEEPSTQENVEVKEEKVMEVLNAPEPTPEPAIELPENVQKLVDFMKDTGGSVEDYVSLNKDYDSLDDLSLVREYYKQKYPHYSDDRISRRMDKTFLYGEDDDPDAIQDKKDAFEDAIFDAKSYLNDRKSKYYDELKLNRKNEIPENYQKAYEVAQNYQQAEETNKQLQAKFAEETNKVFNPDFKGFEFKIGESKYRYKVNEPAKVKEYQSDFNNFIGEFLGEDGAMADASGYHKALFAAKNIDKIANHFYEQGRAEALKQSAKEAKNISMDPRQDMSAAVTTKSGTKVKVVNTNQGWDSGKLRFNT